VQRPWRPLLIYRTASVKLFPSCSRQRPHSASARGRHQAALHGRTGPGPPLDPVGGVVQGPQPAARNHHEFGEKLWRPGSTQDHGAASRRSLRYPDVRNFSPAASLSSALDCVARSNFRPSIALVCPVTLRRFRSSIFGLATFKSSNGAGKILFFSLLPSVHRNVTPQ